MHNATVSSREGHRGKLDESLARHKRVLVSDQNSIGVGLQCVRQGIQVAENASAQSKANGMFITEFKVVYVNTSADERCKKKKLMTFAQRRNAISEGSRPRE